MKRFSQVFGALAIALSLPHFAQAQQGSATFDDGTVIEYEILSDRPEDGSAVGIYWGTMASNVMEGLQVTYRATDDLTLSLQTNVMGAVMYGNDDDSLFVDNKKPAARSFRVRGSYTLKTKEKPKKMGLSLKSESTGYNEVTVYQLQYDVPRVYTLAVRGGFGYRNTDLIGLAPYGITYNELSVGLSWSRSRNIALMTLGGKGKPRKYRGSSQMSLYGDALVFMGTTSPRIEYLESFNSDNATVSPVGFEIGWQGRTSFWGKRDWGFFGQAGYLVTPNHSTPTFGFGIYAGFMNSIS